MRLKTYANQAWVILFESSKSNILIFKIPHQLNHGELIEHGSVLLQGNGLQEKLFAFRNTFLLH